LVAEFRNQSNIPPFTIDGVADKEAGAIHHSDVDTTGVKTLGGKIPGVTSTAVG